MFPYPFFYFAKDFSLTDLIQAICSVVGLVGLIITTVKLLSRDRNRDIEIKEIMKQTELQKESNVLMKDLILSIPNLLDKKEGDVFYTAELKKFEDKKYELRKNDIKPYFIINYVVWNGNDISITMRNVGESAYKIKFEPHNNDNPVLFINLQTSNIVYKNTDKLTFVARKNPNHKEQQITATNLIYSDRDGNFYRQIITLDLDKKKPALTDPIEITNP